jgi:hypothetical protein
MEYARKSLLVESGIKVSSKSKTSAIISVTVTWLILPQQKRVTAEVYATLMLGVKRRREGIGHRND